MDTGDKRVVDDEYQFSEVSGAVPTSSVYSNMGRVKDKNLMRRNVLFGIGILLLILLVYKFINVFFQKKAMPELATSAVTETVTPAPAVVAPVVAEARQGMTEEQMQGVQQMHSDVIELQKNVAQVQGHLGDMDKVSQQMLAQLAYQQRLLFTLTQATIKKPKTVKKLLEPPKQKYFIKAIIPGRAWLFNEKGDFLTVVRGSTIPRYGQANVIDAEQGIITTTSGEVIAFSSADE